MPKEQLDEALRTGFTLPDAAQQQELAKRQQYGQGLGTELRAGAEGAVRGILPIGGDTLLSAIEDKQGVEERKARNPWAAGLGEGAGLVGSLALPGEGEVGLISKAGGIAERLANRGLGEGASSLAKVASKTLAKGAGSAVEGAFYGAGQALSENALGDEDMTAQKALAHIGLGAVFGGAVGGGLAGLGGLVAPSIGKAADVLSERLRNSPGIKARLEQFAGTEGLEAAGLAIRHFRQLSKTVKGLEGTALEGEDMSLLDEATRLLREKDIVKAGDTPEKISEKLQGEFNRGREENKAFIDKLDEVTGPTGLGGTKLLPGDGASALSKGAAVVGKDGQVLTEGTMRFNPADYAAALRKQIAEPLEKQPLRKNIAKKIAEIADDFEAKGTDMSFKEAEEAKRSFNDVFEKNPFNPEKTAISPINDALKKARGIMNGMIEEKARAASELVGPGTFERWLANKREYEALSLVEKAAQDKGFREHWANRKISPSDHGVGIGAAVMAAAGGHGGMASAAMGLAGALANKVVRQYGHSVMADLANRASKLAVLEKAGQLVTQRIDDGVQGFIKALAKPAKLVVPASVGALHDAFLAPAEEQNKRQRQSRQEAFKTRFHELATIVADPRATMDRISAFTAHYDDSAPQVATLMATRAVAAAQYLYSTAPKDPDAAGLINPNASTWHPSDTELAAWERRLHAARDPVSVIDDLKHGHISDEGVETIKAIYPKLYNEIAAKLVPELAEQKDIPFATRMQLSTLFGAPVDALAAPQFVSAMQQTYQKIAVPSGPQKAPISGKNAVAQGSRTPLQRALNNT